MAWTEGAQVIPLTPRRAEKNAAALDALRRQARHLLLPPGAHLSPIQAAAWEAAQDPACLLLCGLKDGHLTGILDAEYRPDGVLTVASLVVGPRWRQRGWGRRLVNAAVQRSPAPPHQLAASVLAHNPEAARFWEALGLELSHTSRRPALLHYLGLAPPAGAAA